MDFIDEDAVYKKIVGPFLAGLKEILEQARKDLDGAELEIEIPATIIKLRLKVPEEKS